jgi:polyphosphate glucokinase
LQRLGKKKWRKVVAEVVDHLCRALQVDYVVLGGGNAHKLKDLPPMTRLGDNSNAMAGGRIIWEMDNPLHLSPKYRARPHPPKQ